MKELGEEAWELLASAFRSNSNVVIRKTRIRRQELAEKRKESIMRIWDATTTSFQVSRLEFKSDAVYLAVKIQQNTHGLVLINWKIWPYLIALA